MNALTDVLLFRRMISPIVLQILYWGATAAVVYFGIQLVTAGYWSGWMALTFGVLGVRVFFELSLLAFRVYDRLGMIQRVLARSETSHASE